MRVHARKKTGTKFPTSAKWFRPPPSTPRAKLPFGGLQPAAINKTTHKASITRQATPGYCLPPSASYCPQP